MVDFLYWKYYAYLAVFSNDIKIQILDITSFPYSMFFE